MNKVCIAGFGEIMLRLSPRGNLRLVQVLPGELNATFGGGEANVCASVALLGLPSRFLTAIPKNPLADALVAELRGLGVDTSKMLHLDEGRLGIYFTEAGASQRGAAVVYDRAGSSISMADAGDYDFDAMLDGVTWLHLTGITPAISEKAYRATLAVAEKASVKGIKISCDLNFRKKLWNWSKRVPQKELVRNCMKEIVAFVDLIVGNEEDAFDVFGISAGKTSVEAGKLEVAAYTEVAEKLSQMFPKATKIAITLRESLSASHNNWGAMLYDARVAKSYFAPVEAGGQYRPYEIYDIVDRIGGGDSFSAGLIYALNSDAYAEPQTALSFAVASSCLKHSVYGDYNYCTVDEVVSLMKGNASGRVKR